MQVVPRPRQGVALTSQAISATPWRGRISLPGSSFPGSSALRASTPGLKSDDPSGTSPLRDRQAGAVGLGSADRIAQRQGLSLLYFKAQMRHPCSPVRQSVLSRNRISAGHFSKTTFGKAIFVPKTTFGKAISYRQFLRVSQLIEGELAALLIGVGTADPDALSSVLGTKKRSYTEYPV